MNTPIKITLYEGDEEKKTYTCLIVPWGVLKKAIALTKNLNAENIGMEDIDAVAELVVMAFGKQFTVDDLDAGADVSEMLAVLQSIVARASGIATANPTPPIPSKKKSK